MDASGTSEEKGRRRGALAHMPWDGFVASALSGGVFVSGGALKVVLVGQGRWSRVLAHGLSSVSDSLLNARALPIEASRRAISFGSLRALMAAHVLVRVGVQPGADTLFGRGFDLCWRLARLLNRRARVVIYWIGTDVANAAEQVRSGRDTTLMYRIVRESRNFAGSKPLVEELASINVTAEPVGFPWTEATFPEVSPDLPDKFAVLTYIPDSRFDFFGGFQIADAARQLPVVCFFVLAGEGKWLVDRPDNLRFLGWQKDTAPWYGDSTVVVRLVKHDSIGGTVMEGLLFGRHVVYSELLPHTVHVPFGDTPALVAKIRSLYEAHERRELRPNVQGRDYAASEFDPQRRLEGLAGALLDVAGRR